MSGSSSSCYTDFLADLKMKVEEPILIGPASPTPSGLIYLSNIDQLVKFPVFTLLFYSKCPQRESHDVVEVIREAYGKVLVPYYFMSGRLKMRNERGKHDIDCNAAGAVFVKAQSGLCINDLGDLRNPNPAFKALISFAPEPLVYPLPLTRLQVTTFKCGGFCIGLTMSHCLMDGFSAAEFLLHFSSIARGIIPPIPPNPDRTLLKPRIPPLTKHTHIEFTTNPPPSFPYPLPSNLYITRVFNLSYSFLQNLKQKVTAAGGPPNCSTFEAVTAQVWQSRAKALQNQEKQQHLGISFAVNIRNRLNPPLPIGFCGNGVFSTVAEATLQEISEQKLGFFAGRVREAVERLSDDYIRSAIDFSEEKSEVMFCVNGVCISAWWRLPFYEADFGWGRPLHVCPLMNNDPNFLLFLAAGDGSKDIDMYVTLEAPAMDRFQQIFFQEILE